MENRFFFLNTYDSISGTILSSILSQHPDIYCSTSYPDPFLPINKAQDVLGRQATIIDFSKVNTSTTHPFSGNAQRYSAYELQNNALIEKTEYPFNAATIVVSPILRIQFLLCSWVNTDFPEDYALNYIEHTLKQLRQTKQTLTSYYNFDYFYQLVLSELEVLTSTALSVKDKLFSLALARVLAQDSADIPVPRKKYTFETLLANPDSVIDLLKLLTNNKINLLPDFVASLPALLQNKRNDIHRLMLPTLATVYTELIDKLIHQKLKTIYYPHLNHSLAYYYHELDYPFTRRDDNKNNYSKLISIQLNSNRPAQLVTYFDNIEETADNPTDIEVLVNIDVGDSAMQAVLDFEIPRRRFTLKYIQTQRPVSFCDLWKPINRLLEITDPNSYFLVNISDEMLFTTHGWDSVLKKYVDFFPDHLFRLRASRNKFRNYFDRWECSFAQDSIPITTKRWIDTGGDWNPCFGPDSFQQLVAFYLAKEGQFSNEQYLREAPLLDIKFAGDVPALGIDKDKAWRHNNDHIKAMLICQSAAMQTEARRRAMLIKLTIIAEAQPLAHYKIKDLVAKKMLHLYDCANNKVVFKQSYALNRMVIFLTNQWRKLAFFSYFGDGLNQRKVFLRRWLQYIKATRHRVYRLEKKLRPPLSKVMRFCIAATKMKNYRPDKIYIFKAILFDTYKTEKLQDENRRLKKLYTIMNIENQKLKDKATAENFNFSHSKKITTEEV